MSGAPELSIVVPTRNRAAKLARCLQALAAQEHGAEVEVLVCDDGSTDETPAVLAAHPEVRPVSRAPGGRSAARNRALLQARAGLVLFVDDDVLASPGLLARHLAFHRTRPDEREALVGLVTWAPELDISAHMRWLEDDGPLFAFNTIADPESVSWRHFCTANVSVKRSFLGPAPFDEELERFTDVELGYRLHRRGMRLHYDAEAVGHHLRFDTPASTRERMRVVGRAGRVLHRKHPELAEAPPPFSAGSHLRAAAAKGLAPLVRRLGTTALDERIWSYDAALAYARGYAEGDRALPEATERVRAIR